MIVAIRNPEIQIPEAEKEVDIIERSEKVIAAALEKPNARNKYYTDFKYHREEYASALLNMGRKVGKENDNLDSDELLIMEEYLAKLKVHEIAWLEEVKDKTNKRLRRHLIDVEKTQARVAMGEIGGSEKTEAFKLPGSNESFAITLTKVGENKIETTFM